MRRCGTQELKPSTQNQRLTGWRDTRPYPHFAPECPPVPFRIQAWNQLSRIGWAPFLIISVYRLWRIIQKYALIPIFHFYRN
jgi:hypothetical protein